MGTEKISIPSMILLFYYSLFCFRQKNVRSCSTSHKITLGDLNRLEMKMKLKSASAVGGLLMSIKLQIDDV